MMIFGSYQEMLEIGGSHFNTQMTQMLESEERLVAEAGKHQMLARLVVPGFLQIRAYADLLINRFVSRDEPEVRREADFYTDVRMARRNLLLGSAVQHEVVISRNVFDRESGSLGWFGADVIREQIDDLIRVAEGTPQEKLAIHISEAYQSPDDPVDTLNLFHSESGKAASIGMHQQNTGWMEHYTGQDVLPWQREFDAAYASAMPRQDSIAYMKEIARNL